MPTFNPYEAPKSTFASPVESDHIDDLQGPWRDGADLVVRHDAHLPQRCIKCNAAAVVPFKRRRYYWHSGGYYLLILINLLIYAVVAAIVRKRVYISAGLCAQHGKRRTTMIVTSLAGGVAAAGVFMHAAQGGYGQPLFLLAAFLLIASIVVGMVGGRFLNPKRITERYARFKGCGPAFVDTLPRFRGADY